VFGAVREVGCPVRISGATPRRRAASKLGGDTDEVLSNYLGCSPQEIAELRSAGVI